MADTKIEYLTKTWNPIQTVIKGESGHGYHCTHVSEGCRNCWAEGMNNRFGNKLPYDAKHLEFEIKESELNKPFSWRKPQVVGVQYMSDLFHEDIPFEMILKVLNVALLNPKHTFVILTKRLNQAVPFHQWLIKKQIYQPAEYPKNILFGCSVEDQFSADHRIPKLLLLKQFFPKIRLWLSVEPMIAAIDLQRIPGLDQQYGCGQKHHGIGTPECPKELHHHHDDRCKYPIDWIVVGGESGKGARSMHPHWARSLRNQCKEANVPYFFKQWGEYCVPEQTEYEFYDKETKRESEFGKLYKIGKKEAGRLLDGVEHNEFPKGV